MTSITEFWRQVGNGTNDIELIEEQREDHTIVMHALPDGRKVVAVWDHNHPDPTMLRRAAAFSVVTKVRRMRIEHP